MPQLHPRFLVWNRQDYQENVQRTVDALVLGDTFYHYQAHLKGSKRCNEYAPPNICDIWCCHNSGHRIELKLTKRTVPGIPNIYIFKYRFKDILNHRMLHKRGLANEVKSLALGSG